MHAVLTVLLSATADSLVGTSSDLQFIGTAPKGFRSSAWLGNYSVYTGKLVERKVGGLLSGRRVFARQMPDGSQDETRLMWYRKHEARWYVGRSRALDKAAGVMYVADSAMAPEQIGGTWQVWLGDKRGWVSSDLRVVTQAQANAIVEQQEQVLQEASDAATSIRFVGQPPEGLRHEWLGNYRQRGGKKATFTNGRPSYYKVDDESKSLWYDGSGVWFMGNTALMGGRKGVFQARDAALVPTAIKAGAWLVSRGKGKAPIPAPSLRWLRSAEALVDLQSAAMRLNRERSRTIYLFDAQLLKGDNVKPLIDAPEWQGAYFLDDLNAHQSYGRYVKIQTPGPEATSPVASWVLWYEVRSGHWVLGRKVHGNRAPKPIFSVYDGAQLPQEIRSTWQRKGSNSRSRADVGIRCLVGAEGAAVLTAQNAVLADYFRRSSTSAYLVGLTQSLHHEWEGNYTRRVETMTRVRQQYFHEHDPSKALWYSMRMRSWLVGHRHHPKKAILRVADQALIPESINATWQKCGSGADGKVCTDEPGVRFLFGSEATSARQTQERAVRRGDSTVYLAGSAPPSPLARAMGAYDALLPAGVQPHSLRRSYRKREAQTQLRPETKVLPVYELNYHELVGEWRVVQKVSAINDTVNATLAVAYDDALSPELITASWKSVAQRRKSSVDDAANLVCRAGREGIAALEADRAVVALQRATLPGWPAWLFPVRLTSLMAAVSASMEAGVSPARVRATLLAAQTHGLAKEMITKALFNVPEVSENPPPNSIIRTAGRSVNSQTSVPRSPHKRGSVARKASSPSKQMKAAKGERKRIRKALRKQHGAQ